MHEMHGKLTVKQLAAFLCVTPSAIRHMARTYGLVSEGKVGQEKLYRAREFVDAVGQHDRGNGRKRRTPTAKLTPEGVDTYTHDPLSALAHGYGTRTTPHAGNGDPPDVDRGQA